MSSSRPRRCFSSEHEPIEALSRWFDRVADYAQVKRGCLPRSRWRVAEPLGPQPGPDRGRGDDMLDAGKVDGTIRPDVDARDVILLIGYLTRIDQAEWDARASLARHHPRWIPSSRVTAITTTDSPNGIEPSILPSAAPAGNLGRNDPRSRYSPK